MPLEELLEHPVSILFFTLVFLRLRVKEMASSWSQMRFAFFYYALVASLNALASAIVLVVPIRADKIAVKRFSYTLPKAACLAQRLSRLISSVLQRCSGLAFRQR